MNGNETLRELVSLEGKVALVAGGGGGIGTAIADLFVRAGARVVSADLPGRPSAPSARSIECDVADRAQVQELFRTLRGTLGRLDVLVHAAGITRDAVLWKMQDEAWSEVLRVNLDSAFLLLREAAPLLRERGDGAVVLVSSINGERGKFGQGNYAASKAGLIGLGRTAARELGKFGVRVNILAPGLIETPMIAGLPGEIREQAAKEAALGRVGGPEDVAGAALFLVSPMARHVTGQVLRVDGGQLMA